MIQPIPDDQADAIERTAFTLFTDAYGSIGAIDWQAILAAFAAVLSNCMKPTPTSVRAAAMQHAA